MATVLRRSLAAMLVVAVIWCLVVFWWHATEASPSAIDLVLWLGVLPAGLVGGYWLLSWGRDRAKHREQAPAEAGIGGAGASPQRALPDLPLQVLAAATCLPVGNSPQEVLARLATPMRAGLHRELKDAAGLPVFAASIEGLDPDAMERALLTLPGGDDAALSSEQLRALALLEPVAEELLALALPAPADPGDVRTSVDASVGMHPHAMSHSRSIRAAAESAPAPVLQVRLLLPSTWPPATRSLAVAWLAAKAVMLGLPADRVALEAVPVNSSADVWQLLGQIAQARSDDAVSDCHLLLATDSLIGGHSIHQLDARSRLLGSQNPEGIIPGEGAAGVLLAGSEARAVVETPGGIVACVLHRPAHAQTLLAANTRRAAELASQLATRALGTAEQSLDNIALVVTDADHRGSRMAEAMGAVSTTLPELDPVRHCLNLGTPCGELGPVMPLALIAVAAAQVQESRAPVLVLSVADERERIAFALSPAPMVEPDDAVVANQAAASTPAKPAPTPISRPAPSAAGVAQQMDAF